MSNRLEKEVWVKVDCSCLSSIIHMRYWCIYVANRWWWKVCLETVCVFWQIWLHGLWHQVLLASIIMMTLISTSQASEELNYTPTWLSRWVLWNHKCVISHHAESMLHAYIASSKLAISSIKGMIIESLNVRKVTQLSMINPFQLKSMENKGFPSSKPLAPFQHRTSGINKIILLHSRHKI